MKFMKLGTRPDTFFTAEAIRSVSSEVSTDIKIKVQNSLYLLHKFPLLSRCLRLRTLCSEWKGSPDDMIIELSEIPGGAEAFEVCTKFCYGITITLSALNFVTVEGFADDAPGNKTVPASMRRAWNHWPLRRCPCLKDHRTPFKGRLVSLQQRMVGGEALQVYAFRWLPNMWRDGQQSNQMPEYPCSESLSLREITMKHRLILEKLVSLLPSDKGALPCGFLLKLLKSANVLNASPSSKLELARRVGLQLEEATVSDLLIPSLSYVDETLYDVDIVTTILEEFLLQGQSPPTSPPRGRFGYERRRSRSAENVEFEGHDNSRRSSSASHSSKLRVAKLIDCYLQEIARDANLPMEKVIALAEAVPDFARTDHDDLYKVIDIYLRAHPELNKSARKKLCRILNCKKLSMEACVHAAQNDMLPLRVVVQVLFFEQARAAAVPGGQMNELPNNIKQLLATTSDLDDDKEAATHRPMATASHLGDSWSISGLKYPTANLETLKMKLEEADNDIEDDILHRNGLLRSSSTRFKALCSIPNKPKRIFSKLWSMNRSVRERQ
ncbi:uncharacterized protein A4U43_C09F16280 [Asparagus officinalis]|uniref:NPH3 domain-containing protein n=1 Tax=Asparagus officinalis TaxID=4686 RepID=A0A5P1E7Y7_ASPOF|nr:uncharacterized protein A4U43_C09F16280 [Asparagus officinalis]